MYKQINISNLCLHDSTFLVVDMRQILVNVQKYKEIDDSYHSLLVKRTTEYDLNVHQWGLGGMV